MIPKTDNLKYYNDMHAGDGHAGARTIDPAAITMLPQGRALHAASLHETPSIFMHTSR